MMSEVRITTDQTTVDATVFGALVNPCVLQGWILALISLEKDCASVRLGSAATRQKTRETRVLYCKWLCESRDTLCEK